MKNTKAQGGHIIAGASIVGGIVLAALTIAQGWSGFSTIFAAPPSEPSRNCNSSEPLPHVYDLNPRFGTEYPGANQWADNGTAVECQRTRKLLNRDELRLRPTVSTPKKSGSTFSDGRMPLFGRVFPDGLYYIAMGIGSPPRTYFLDIDTGSDLTWLSCDAPCVSCAQGPHPWYSPKTARLVDCQAELCAGVQIGKIQGCAAGGGGGARQCDYDVHYGDGSSSQGVLVADTLVFLHPDGKLVAAKVALGCAYDQEGGLKSSPSMTDGLLGLGSAAVSVPSQLAKQGAKGNVCLAVLDSGVVAPGGATTIIGDVSLKGYLTVYDNVNYRVGWAPSDCSQKP
eukprot:jgi/Mesen1/6690/ME000343S05869